jgi:hypothetical protein
MEGGHWSEQEWTTLMYVIERNNCILMLGPDASYEPIDGQTQPLTEILAKELAEEIRPEIRQNLDPSNLTQIAQYFLIETKMERPDLEAKVQSFYNARQNLTTQLYHDLAALPFYLTVVSTPDTMFCEALRANQKEPIIASYNFRGESEKMVQMGAPEKPLVFYLYGTIDEPESLVLTENDLLDFLAAVIAKSPSLPSNILSELRDKNKSLLFLGFGFRRWYLHILLHVLLGHDKKSRSFALEQCALRNVEEFQKMILFFRMSDYKITLCERELQSFVTELKQRYHERSVTPKSSRIELQDVPNVFLCHSRSERDKNYAKFLRDQLTKEGFKAWFDPDDSRRSHEQEQNIKSAIIQEIDYFIVLQSQALIAKSEDSSNILRLRQEKQSLEEQWELLSKKAAKLEKDRILETQADVKFRLEQLIEEAEAERQQIGQRLKNIETQMAMEIHVEQSSFHEEIRLAVERQKDFQGFHFIIAVKVEDSPLLEELKTFLSIDLTDPNNIEKLVRTIKRDQELRKKRP